VDVPRLCDHLARRLAEGCSSYTLFGTTGEGASFGWRERVRTIEQVLAKLPAGRALIGVIANAARDAAEQANPLLDAGGQGVLLAPPSYFKNVPDEGLYRWFSEAIGAMRAPRGVFLYHIPSVTSVPLSCDLIGRLRRAFPGIVAGVKDSAGDWPYTEALLAAHGDLHILVGDERLLARAIRAGGSGAINGFSNFCTPQLLPMIDRGDEVPAISALVDLLLEYPVTPAIKALVAHISGDPAFARVAPPLGEIDEAACARLVAAWQRID
jgi:4-hydroxy-tetrahydrodipicolinate synthase